MTDVTADLTPEELQRYRAMLRRFHNGELSYGVVYDGDVVRRFTLANPALNSIAVPIQRWRGREHPLHAMVTYAIGDHHWTEKIAVEPDPAQIGFNDTLMVRVPLR